MEPPAVRRPAAATVLSQVQDMHTPDEVGNVHGLYCPECGTKWPCRTYKFIKSQEA